MAMDVKQRILDSACNLFLKQGYYKTTIKQIVKESGVQTGSIYHFFKNKEEIFKHLALFSYDYNISITRAYYEGIQRNISKSFLYCMVALNTFYIAENYKNNRELLYIAYQSKSTLEEIINNTNKFSSECFKQYNLDTSNDEFYLKTLIVSGSIYAFLSNQYFDTDISFINRWRSFLHNTLMTYHVPEKEIKELISKKSLDQMLLDEAQIISRFDWPNLLVNMNLEDNPETSKQS